MYADRVGVAGSGSRKRSVKDRLGAISESGDNITRQNFSKRFRQDDSNWHHDLYDDELDLDATIDKQAGTEDLRAKLNKNLPKSGQGGAGSVVGVKDLRERLSGAPAPAPAPAAPVKQQHVSSITKDETPTVTVMTENKPVAVKASTTQKVPTMVAKMQSGRSSQAEVTNVSNFLQSLGLSKYAITFQAEEIDMSILRHMCADDLKELGVPMGPRKKILLALSAQSKR